MCAEMDGNSALRPQPLCPTRFLLRVRSLRALKENYNIITELLRAIGHSSEKAAPKAAGLHHQLLRAETYFCMLVCIDLFQIVEQLSTAIQKPTAALTGILEAAETVKVSLTARAPDFSAFEALWNEVNGQITAGNIYPSEQPRRRSAPRRYKMPDPVSFASARDKLWKVYHDAFSKAATEVGRRFAQEGIKTYIKMEDLVMNGINGVTDEASLERICSIYGLEKQQLVSNISTLKYSGKSFKSFKDVIVYVRGLTDEGKRLYAELVRLIKIFLLFPVSSCTAERSFSVLKRVKSYLRSTMGQERLNHCCIINCYKELSESLDVIELMREFVNSERRIKTFGKF